MVFPVSSSSLNLHREKTPIDFPNNYSYLLLLIKCNCVTFLDSKQSRFRLQLLLLCIKLIHGRRNDKKPREFVISRIFNHSRQTDWQTNRQLNNALDCGITRSHKIIVLNRHSRHWPARSVGGNLIFIILNREKEIVTLIEILLYYTYLWVGAFFHHRAHSWIKRKKHVIITHRLKWIYNIFVIFDGRYVFHCCQTNQRFIAVYYCEYIDWKNQTVTGEIGFE